MILMIDNYDSFTYNLVQYLRELGQEILVHRNDQITVSEISQLYMCTHSVSYTHLTLPTNREV